MLRRDPACPECFTLWIGLLQTETLFGAPGAEHDSARIGLRQTGGFQKDRVCALHGVVVSFHRAPFLCANVTNYRLPPSLTLTRSMRTV